MARRGVIYISRYCHLRKTSLLYRPSAAMTAKRVSPGVLVQPGMRALAYSSPVGLPVAAAPWLRADATSRSRDK